MTKYIIVFLIFFSSVCTATEFYKSRQWLNLLYYEKAGGGYCSLADDYRFFNSQTGRTDPKSEYEVSLSLTKQQDSDFRKKFPLRYKVIAKIHNIPYKPLITPNKDIQSAIIAFPNRYMANPASMFGHLFIILKSKHGLMDSDILHYLADTAGTSQYAYVFNGLSGKFKGWFLQEPYYMKIKTYNHVEDREIIYYDLKLSKEKVQELQLHAIELKQSYFNYYFLDENCAYFIGKLLNTVLDEDIVNRQQIIFPSQIVNRLHKKTLLKNEHKRKPSTKLFSDSFRKLDANQQKEVLDLILYKADSISSNTTVLKTFIHISEYLINNQSYFAQNIRHNRIKAYKELKKVNSSNVRPLSVKQPYISPIKSKGVGLGYGFSNRLFLYYNPIYYGKYESYSEIESKKISCLAPRLVFGPQKPQLDLTLIDIANISQYNTVLNDYSWKINSFLTYQDTLGTNQSFELGRAYRISDQGLLFGFVGFNYSNYDHIAEQRLPHLIFRPSVNLGIDQQIITGYFNAGLAYSYRYDNHYLTAKVEFKVFEILSQLTYVRSNVFDGIRFSLMHIY